MKISKEELAKLQKELEKCKQDIIYFAEYYFHVQQLNWRRRPLKLNEFQRNLLTDIQNNHFKISVLAKRNMGKTVLCLMYCAWKFLFFPCKQIALICPNRRTKENCFEVLKIAFEKMPIWMTPKFKMLKRPTRFEAENMSSIQIETYDSAEINFCGRCITDLILDENNFSNNWLDKNYFIIANRFPVNVLAISSINPWQKINNHSRIVMISKALSKGNCEWVVVKKL